MREIKFRVYDYIGKQMLFPGDKSNIMNRVQYELVFTGKITFQEYEYETGFRKFFPNNHLAVMQYTGFKDKNGKEIYDGDILEKKILGLFKYICARFNVALGVWMAEYNLSSGKEWFPLWQIANESIVSGNIYENPDLLKC